MTFLFVRHTTPDDAHPDSERELTAKGREEAAALGHLLKASGIQVQAAYSSPLIRARQTAGIILTSSGSSVPSDAVVGAPELLNEATEETFRSWLRALPESPVTLLVGHAPRIADRVARLLGAPEESFSFSKGAMAALETSDRRAFQLLFYVSPALLAEFKS